MPPLLLGLSEFTYSRVWTDVTFATREETGRWIVDRAGRMFGPDDSFSCPSVHTACTRAEARTLHCPAL